MVFKNEKVEKLSYKEKIMIFELSRKTLKVANEKKYYIDF